MISTLISVSDHKPGGYYYRIVGKNFPRLVGVGDKVAIGVILRSPGGAHIYLRDRKAGTLTATELAPILKVPGYSYIRDVSVRIDRSRGYIFYLGDQDAKRTFGNALVPGYHGPCFIESGKPYSEWKFVVLDLE